MSDDQDKNLIDQKTPEEDGDKAVVDQPVEETPADVQPSDQVADQATPDQDLENPEVIEAEQVATEEAPQELGAESTDEAGAAEVPGQIQEDLVAEEPMDVQDSSEESAQPASEEPIETETAAAEDAELEKTEEASPDQAEGDEKVAEGATEDAQDQAVDEAAQQVGDDSDLNPNARWYVVHTYSGHENKVLQNLKQKIASEHLENKIFDILVPTQDKIEIRSGKKEQVKEKIFPGYILVRMDLDDASWLAVRTTPGVTAFVGIGNKPTPISEAEVRSIVQFMSQGAPATFKDVFLPDDTVKIIDGPFAEFIGKVDTVDKEKGKVRVLVSIFGRETPVELDFLQVQKL